jgi:hypothetical protein
MEIKTTLKTDHFVFSNHENTGISILPKEIFTSLWYDQYIEFGRFLTKNNIEIPNKDNFIFYIDSNTYKILYFILINKKGVHTKYTKINDIWYIEDITPLINRIKMWLVT